MSSVSSHEIERKYTTKWHQQYEEITNNLLISNNICNDNKRSTPTPRR